MSSSSSVLKCLEFNYQSTHHDEVLTFKEFYEHPRSGPVELGRLVDVDGADDLAFFYSVLDEGQDDAVWRSHWLVGAQQRA